MAEKMVRLRSAVHQIYGGRMLKPGDPFPAPVPERTARGLIQMHFAEEDHGTYETTAMTAANTQPLARKRGKGSYKRRDMRAK